MDPSLALILVTHNSEPWLAPFFQTWSVAAEKFHTAHEIIVADSGSTTSPQRQCAQLSPAARVIHCGNIGYGAAINRAVAATTAPWLLLCNPDITFAPDFLKYFAALPLPDRCEVQLIAPTLLNPDGSRQPSIGKFPTIRGIIADQFRPRAMRKYGIVPPVQTTSIDWAAGACILITRPAFESVGGFDEKFFLYVEEVDFQYRLHKAHCSKRFVPDFTVTHHAPNASRPHSAEVGKYSARGLLRYFAKHGTAAQLLQFRLIALAARRLSPCEALASKQTILDTFTGP